MSVAIGAVGCTDRLVSRYRDTDNLAKSAPFFILRSVWRAPAQEDGHEDDGLDIQSFVLSGDREDFVAELLSLLQIHAKERGLATKQNLQVLICGVLRREVPASLFHEGKEPCVQFRQVLSLLVLAEDSWHRLVIVSSVGELDQGSNWVACQTSEVRVVGLHDTDSGTLLRHGPDSTCDVVTEVSTDQLERIHIAVVLEVVVKKRNNHRVLREHEVRLEGRQKTGDRKLVVGLRREAVLARPGFMGSHKLQSLDRAIIATTIEPGAHRGELLLVARDNVVGGTGHSR